MHHERPVGVHPGRRLLILWADQGAGQRVAASAAK
jgi:hypothetical protein